MFNYNCPSCGLGLVHYDLAALTELARDPVTDLVLDGSIRAVRHKGRDLFLWCADEPNASKLCTNEPCAAEPCAAISHDLPLVRD